MNIDQLKEVIASALPNCDVNAVTADSMIVPDVCADSLDAVELSMAIEEQLEVSMPDGLLATMMTVKDLLTYLSAHAA